MDQIGNTITYYTRTHVVAEGNRRDKEKVNEEFARFAKLAGLNK